ncbi:polyprenyl synthetase family protein [Micrococcoides hystricis]|uniref:Polyprenyl synthetase family protein n=1 Tax=Micrococcoides hystricis TaxID=1572761 RepID=A0ABV6P8V9_9MICC
MKPKLSEDLKLPAGFAPLAEDPSLAITVMEALADIEQRLAEAVKQNNVLADVSSRHLLQAGGKRVRPLLTVLSALAVGELTDGVKDAAVVLELTHLATLYHDDVMDSAQMRRGAEAAHQIWGNSVAILTGDLIFARAARLMSTLGAEPVAIQAETFERLVMGQLLETTGKEDGQGALEHYLEVISGKTSSLIAACGRVGALLGGGTQEQIQHLSAYGEKVGTAFQLADDVIDVTSEHDVSGKTPGTDLREGVRTLPVLLLEKQAATDTHAAALLARIDADLSSHAALEAVVTELAAHPVAEESWEYARRWAAEGKSELASLPDTTAKKALMTFADAVVDRDF